MKRLKFWLRLREIWMSPAVFSRLVHAELKRVFLNYKLLLVVANIVQIFLREIHVKGIDLVCARLMGLIWSTVHGKVQNNSQLNEEKEVSEELTQDDSDTNSDEIFFETVDIVSSQRDDLVVQELETQNMSSYTSSRPGYEVSLDESTHEERIPRCNIHEMPINMDSCNNRYPSTAKYEENVSIDELPNPSWRAQNIPFRDPFTVSRTVCEVSSNNFQDQEKIPLSDVHKRSTNIINLNNTSTTESEELTSSSQRVHPCLEEGERVRECSPFSLPLIAEENIFLGKHAKYTSEPEMSRSAISSRQLQSETPSSCAWQIDVDCFKSKKRKKPPAKYLRSKEPDHTYANPRTGSTDKQDLDTRKWLITKEIATQEMMERRKVLNLRRW